MWHYSAKTFIVAAHYVKPDSAAASTPKSTLLSQCPIWPPEKKIQSKRYRIHVHNDFDTWWYLCHEKFTHSRAQPLKPTTTTNHTTIVKKKTTQTRTWNMLYPDENFQQQ